MNDDRLTELLEDHVAGVSVAPPPTDGIRAGARRHARRVRLAVTAAAAVMLAIATIAFTSTCGGSERAVEPAVSGVDTPPPGMHYVGIGRAVIAVPDGLRTVVDGLDCLRPGVDAVVIGAGVGCVERPDFETDRDLVEITAPPPPGKGTSYVGVGAHPVDVGGEEAIRSTYGVSGMGAKRQQAVVYLPDSGVLFTIYSSKPDAETRVNSLADTITLLRAHTTVPGFSDPFGGGLSPTGPDLAAYRTTLEAASLKLAEDTRATTEITSVEPPVGSVVDLGSSVTVTTRDSPHA